MRYKILILFALFFCSFIKAKYLPTPLWEMALTADKIVYGEITELHENDYTLKIISNATNDSGTIKIQRFKDWTCAARWTPYAKGQKVVVFLEKRENVYHIMSGGGEGEMEVMNENVNFKNYIIDCNVKDIKSDLKVNSFIKNIKKIRDCYSLSENTFKITRKCQEVSHPSPQRKDNLFDCLETEIWEFEKIK